MRKTRSCWMLLCALLTLGCTAPALAQSCEHWRSANLHTQIRGVDGIVYAATVWTPPGPGSVPWLVVGGDFDTAGGVTVNNIAAWDGASWRPLFTGMNGRVFALTVYNGELIAGGEFNGAWFSANRIARFDGTIWHALGDGLELSQGGALRCSGLTVFNGELIATGAFWSAGGVSARNIARWNGSSWGPLAGGLSKFSVQDPAYGNVVTAHNGMLYVGGYFDMAGTAIASNIAQWNGASWSAMGSGVDAAVNDMISFNGELAVAGYFAHAGGQPHSRVAHWNGASWGGYGPGVNNPCSALHNYFGQLLVGSGGGADSLKSFNGETWNAVGGGISGGLELITAMTIYNGELILGGGFHTAGPGSIEVNNVARWDGSFWNPLWVPPPVVTAFATLGSRLVVAGAFTQSTNNGLPASNIMAWDGARKYPLLQGVNAVSGIKGELNSVRALKSYTTGFGGFTTQNLVVGGYFTSAGGLTANRIARWSEPTLTFPSWSTMGNGFNAGVFAIERHNNEIYAGGEFTFSGGTSVNRIARWTGSSWVPLGSGMNGNVYALESYDGYLYAGGDFGTAGGVTTGGLARWNGSSWSNVGGTFVGTVLALEYYLSGGSLAIGGLFPGFTGAPNVALYGGSYSPLDTGGTDAPVLALLSVGDDLYIGGSFTAAGGLSAAHLARWSHWEGWRTVRGGADSAVLALGSHQIEVQAGGVFDHVENATIPARAWGRYVQNETPWIVQHPQPQSVDCHNYVYLQVVLPTGYALQKYWMKDGEPVAGNGWQPYGSYVWGQNTDTLNFDNVHAFDAGNYSCVILNECGEIESFQATLTVTNCCVTDIAPSEGNQLVNIDDLVILITSWGPCPELPDTCVADVAPFGGNGVVDIDDLVRVITSWGSCP